MPLQIAIDGPVAAGKGTVARLLASRLGFLYVDTGAMYRTTALLAKQQGVDWNDEAKLVEMLGKHTITLRNPLENEKDGRQITVLLDGEDVSWAIRTEEMSRGSSIVSQFQHVRKVLVEQQRNIARTTDVVMEGRDITFRVLPEAQLKIYLDATLEVRAKRRHSELLTRGTDTSYKDVLRDIQERDNRDMHRDVDPLHIVEGAWVLDTSPLTIDEVVDIIEKRVKTLQQS
ncbi:MAG TPA: (d)CMP kinase [Candidatus Pacebacteria bacterium]|nr:MAG: Cytidylate kinase [Microgenomates group bacterium GW2011_GWB1_45_17]KKU23145.1 MAG: Cytidylate kinase [Microgenomates group bacterium GW2011_GWA1_46_15]KKU23808.1 MAG: Cytidylate kinase [Microgenomates group bacterium GW2011_GWC1_46_15]HAV15082.1 (d)CMP kinase [Candidatus Paceibacterota bacterium]HCR11659.1 (d)CMP kinase [Candidatus Paceibacterota bacterium]